MRPGKRTLVFLLVVAVLLIAAFFLRHPVMRAVREWRFDANFTKAERALENEDLAQASQFLGAAWRIGPPDVAALAKLMELAESIQSPDLPAIALVRFAHPQATVEDQVAVMDLGLRRGDLAFVSKLYDSLSAERRANPLIQFTYADFLERSGRTLEAVEMVRGLENSPRGSEAQLRLTRLLPKLSDNPFAHQQVRELVTGLIAAGDERALPAFRNLRLLPAAERQLAADLDLEAWLATQSEATLRDRLLATEIAMRRATPAERGRLAAAALEKHQEKDPTVVARWLLETGEASLILGLPKEVLRSEESFYVAYLQILIDQKRYKETREWLDDPHPKLDAILADAVRAGLAFKEGDGVKRVLHWQRALEQAGYMQSYGSYRAILQIAQRFEDTETVRSAALEIAKLTPRALPSTQELLFLDFELGDDPAFLEEFYQRVEASRPKDPVALHQLAVVRLIRGGAVEDALDVLERLAANHPNLLAFQCSLALAQLLDGRGVEARDLLLAQDADWNTEANPFEKAVFSLVMRRHGDERMAIVLERSIDWARLPAYQREFFQSEIAKPQIP